MRGRVQLVYIFFTLWLVLPLVGCNSEGDVYVASGSFEAEEVMVSSEVSGRLVWWNVKEGDALTKGVRVGQIDTVQLYLKRAALFVGKEGVSASRPDMDKQTASLREQLGKLEKERVRAEKLVAANAMNRKQLDDIESQIRVLNQELVAAESKIVKSVQRINAESSSLDIQVAQLNDMLSKCAVQSPIDGIVLENYVHEGELAVAGHPLFQVADMSELYLRAYLPYYKLSSLRLGDSVDVFCDHGEGGQRQYRGKVSWISSQAEFTPKNVQGQSERENLVYAVRVAVPNDGYLKIAMYGEIRFSARNGVEQDGVE